MEIIDSHQHFWQISRGDYTWLTPQLTALYRDFLPQDYAQAVKNQHPKLTLLVQAAASDAETDYILRLAETNAWVGGVVAWLDFSAKEALARLNTLAANSYVKGVRPMLQDIEETNWILNPSFAVVFNRLIEHNLCFDALIQVRHLDTIDKLATRYPDLKIIVDHCAKPKISAGVSAQWQAGIEALAKHKNLLLKFSGLPTEARANQQSPADFQKYFSTVLQAFGSKRLLWGSDWPVVNINSSYEDWLNICKTLTQSLCHESKQDFWCGTAKRIYSLENRNN